MNMSKSGGKCFYKLSNYWKTIFFLPGILVMLVWSPISVL